MGLKIQLELETWIISKQKNDFTFEIHKSVDLCHDSYMNLDLAQELTFQQISCWKHDLSHHKVQEIHDTL